MKYYMTSYEYVSGDHGVGKQRLFSVPEGETIEGTLFSFFSDFFGDGTILVNRNTYYSSDEEEVIKVTGYREVPEEDAVVIQKYLH